MEIQSLSFIRQAAQTLRNIKFEDVDKNHDGKITKNEFANLVEIFEEDSFIEQPKKKEYPPFNEFVEEAYRGIPDSTTTIKDKYRGIEAKIKIMNHPDCPEDSKKILKKEINVIKSEINLIEAEKKYQKANHRLKQSYKNFIPEETTDEFNNFIEKIYSKTNTSNTPIGRKYEEIENKIAIINHPDCPNNSKNILAIEIQVLKNEIDILRSKDTLTKAHSDLDKTYNEHYKKGPKSDFAKFVENAYANIPDRTTNLKDKIKAINAKAKIMNHKDCPESSKKDLAREIAIIQNEISEINQIDINLDQKLCQIEEEKNALFEELNNPNCSKDRKKEIRIKLHFLHENSNYLLNKKHEIMGY